MKALLALTSLTLLSLSAIAAGGIQYLYMEESVEYKHEISPASAETSDALDEARSKAIKKLVGKCDPHWKDSSLLDITSLKQSKPTLKSETSEIFTITVSGVCKKASNTNP